MSDFQLTVDFLTDSRNPSRVFRSMAGLIETFGRFDRDFFSTIDLPFQSEILLHDIEKGSLRAILREVLKLPDREALREGDWKKVVGRAIDDARTFLLKRLGDEPEIVERVQLERIQTGVIEIASSVPDALIHVPRPIPLPRLLTIIENLESSTRVLFAGDSAKYESETSHKEIPANISISPALKDELYETIPIQRPTRTRLPVKKPDLIGDSQWDLYMGGRVIRAKILHKEWLEKFHSRSIELRPGDMLDAMLEITLLQSPEGEVVGYRYQVLEVFAVIQQEQTTQMEFPDDYSP
jgi:hypothetical protein